jgi:hypothetical protein
MKILQGDEWANKQMVQSFLREDCPEERKAEVEGLLSNSDWPTLDDVLAPFYNVEQ